MSAADYQAFSERRSRIAGLSRALRALRVGAVQECVSAALDWRYASVRALGSPPFDADPYDSESFARGVLALAAQRCQRRGRALARPWAEFLGQIEAELAAAEPHFAHAPRLLALAKAHIRQRLRGLQGEASWPGELGLAELNALVLFAPISGWGVRRHIQRDPRALLRFAALAAPSLSDLISAGLHLSPAATRQAAEWRMVWALRAALAPVRSEAQMPPRRGVSRTEEPSLYAHERWARIVAMAEPVPRACTLVVGSADYARTLAGDIDVLTPREALGMRRWPIGQYDRIIAVDALHLAPNRAALGRTVIALAQALNPGGVLVLAHDHQLIDDPDSPGFDHDVQFGAQSISEIAESAWQISLDHEIRTPHYRIARFRQADDLAASPRREQVNDAPLPAHFARVFLGKGALARRSELALRERTNRLPILRYARVTQDGGDGSQSLATLEAQLGFLRRHGFSGLCLSELLEAQETGRALAGRPVLLTFDDGYEDFGAVAECLDYHGFPAVLCVSTDKIGLGADWEGPSGQPLLGRHALASLYAGGLEIAALGAARAPLTALSDAAIEAQLKRAFEELSAILGQAPLALAYPMGAHDPWVRAHGRAAGFRLGLTQRPRFARLADDPMQLARWSVPQEPSLSRFARFVLSAH